MSPLPHNYLLALAIILSTMFITVRIKKLTVPASIAGGIIGSFVFLGTGFTGLTTMATFFILGTAATSWKGKSKTSLGIAEENQGQRKALQVIANAGIAGTIGAYLFFSKTTHPFLHVGIAASFAAATGDTLSSELGNVYGSRYYNILTLKKDQRGLNGVVSLEGTLAGILGSMVIAGIYCVGYGWAISFLWIVIAGVIGNLVDSVLGATVERKHVLGNDAVNFINTCVGAVVGMLLG